MPFYEGIGLISEKAAVVIDIGSAYTKCGFAGETSPRSIIPTEVIDPVSLKVKKVRNYKNEYELGNLLAHLLHQLYYKCLLVNPKDQRLVIIESMLSPMVFRNTLVKVLFTKFEVPSILIVPSHVVSLFTLKLSCALVVDAGFIDTVVLPVYEGYPVLKAIEDMPLGAQSIHCNLKELIQENCFVKAQNEELIPMRRHKNLLNESLLEDIKVRLCCVTTLSRSKSISSQDPQFQEMPGVDYPLGGESCVIIPGIIREKACEALFEQDNDQVSISTMILDSILKSPVDIRKSLAENILFIGGTSMTAGFKSRILEEVNFLVTTERYKNRIGIKTFKVHTPPSRENYTAWLGGAILGTTDLVISKAFTKDQFSKHQAIPDWCSLLTFYEDDNPTLSIAEKLKS